MRLDIPCAMMAILLPLAITGCNAEKPSAAKSGTASGEILPGSASDAMLPYDALRSQPPIAESSDGQAQMSEGAGAERASKPKVAELRPAEVEIEEAAPPEVMPDAE